ncbi:DUF4924 domain-containing protein [Bacteroidia bacterium]|nr:DUF4924 domain-containing protein [Bacteroidia bacterium]
MLIARQKKKDNMGEYILYMWQLEDMLRGMSLDMKNVEEHIIRHYEVDEATRKEIYDWYDNLIEMMKLERVEEKGHLQILKNNVNELTELHFYLLQQVHDSGYYQVVTRAANNLLEFRSKSLAAQEMSDVEIALNGLYGYLLLKLQNKVISAPTQQAMESFSKMLAYLSAKYKEDEEKEKNQNL